MGFWSWVLEFGPILADIVPAAAEFCGRLWHIFRLMMHQMLSIGERYGLQAGQFSTRTLLLWSHAVVIAAVCGFALSCWNTHRLEGSICCLKPLYYLSAFIVLPKICKRPYRMHLCTPMPSEMLVWMNAMTPWKVSLLFSLEDSVSVISNKYVKFGLVWPWNTFSLENSPFKWALAHRTRRRFWTMFTYADGTVDCVYRQWFLEVFLGPF